MVLLDNLRFSRLRDGLSKTRDSIRGKLREVFSRAGPTDETFWESLEEALLAGDIGAATSAEIVRRMREALKRGERQRLGGLGELVREEMRKLFVNGGLAPGQRIEDSPAARPYVIMVVGVNGVGKTTTIGKLAHRYKASGKRVLVAAADTFRAAAHEQLETWSQRAGVELIGTGSHRGVADPAAVAFDALTAAVSRKCDVMIIDTAGRLHTKTNLMDELKKIKRVLQKQVPEAPHDILLVLDASIGQNAIEQARQFDSAVGVTGIVVTKLDGTAKGGVVLAISRDLTIPVKFIGVGEQIEDLQPFDGNAFVEALLGDMSGNEPS